MADGNSPTQGSGSGILPATPATQGEASGEVLNTSRTPSTADFLELKITAIFNRLESLSLKIYIGQLRSMGSAGIPQQGGAFFLASLNLAWRNRILIP